MRLNVSIYAFCNARQAGRSLFPRPIVELFSDALQADRLLFVRRCPLSHQMRIVNRSLDTPRSSTPSHDSGDFSSELWQQHDTSCWLLSPHSNKTSQRYLASTASATVSLLPPLSSAALYVIVILILRFTPAYLCDSQVSSSLIRLK